MVNPDPLQSHKSIFDVLTLVSGIIGAIVGGVCAYLASTRLETNKRRDLIQRLHCILIDEITGHQASLRYILDGVMSSWLQRGEVVDGQDINLVKIEKPGSVLSQDLFKRYSDKLIESKLVVPISQYYDSVASLNWQIEHWDNANDKTLHVMSAIRLCAQVLRDSIRAMEDLLKTYGIEKYFTERLKNDIENFRIGKEDYLRLYELSKLKDHELFSLYYFLLGPEHNRDSICNIPEIILKAPISTWQSYIQTPKHKF